MNTNANSQITAAIQNMTVTDEQANAVLAFLNGNASIKLYKVRPVKEAPVALPCLCGCDENAKAGSRFIPGHDSRVKGFLGKARKYRDATEEDRTKLATVRFPQVLVDRANADADLVIAGYNAAAILELSEIAGVVEGE